MSARTLPTVKVHGSPYRRGFQHGSQCGDLIARYADTLLQTIAQEGSWRSLRRGEDELTRETLISRARAFLPQMVEFAPHLVEEIRGIAYGAKVPFAEALLCNVRGEVLGVESARCTAIAAGQSATQDGQVLAGQNLDQSPLNEELQIILHVVPDKGPPMLMCSFAGLVGYPGVNAEGVWFFQNAVSTNTWRANGIPHYFLKRVLLEQTRVEECLDVLARARVCSSGNYVLGDRCNVLDVEVTPEGRAVLAPADDLVAHANHFLSPEFAPQDTLLPSLPDSARRYERARALLAARRGAITLATLKEALADHADYPTSICRHQDDLATISSIIAEPESGRLHVAVGNPCQNPYVTYSL